MRKRRTRYTWFPNIGFQGADEENDSAGFPFSHTVSSAAGAIVTNIFELIPDFSPSEPTATTDNLSDFIGNEYLLKRVVGKLFVGANASVPTGPVNFIFGAGLFVARADEAAPQLPVGAGTPAEANLNYGVLNNQNIREPWLWRRVWKLQNPGIPVPNGLLGTWAGGSLQDGPHIDAKSARRVRQDERLFMSVSSINFDGLSASASITLDGWCDYRVLGQLRKAKNRSTF